MSVENTVTGGFGWKHAGIIVLLGMVAAAAYQANLLGLGSIAQKVVGTVKGVTGNIGV